MYVECLPGRCLSTILPTSPVSMPIEVHRHAQLLVEHSRFNLYITTPRPSYKQTGLLHAPLPPPSAYIQICKPRSVPRHCTPLPDPHIRSPSSQSDIPKHASIVQEARRSATSPRYSPAQHHAARRPTRCSHPHPIVSSHPPAHPFAPQATRAYSIFW